MILKSRAQLAASLSADWDADKLAVPRQLLGVVEARPGAGLDDDLVWPAEADVAARSALADLVARGARPRAERPAGSPSATFCRRPALLAGAGIGPVAASRPEHMFEPISDPAEALATRIGVEN